VIGEFRYVYNDWKISFSKWAKLHNMLRQRRVLSEFQYPKYLQILKDGMSACKKISVAFIKCLF